MVECASCNTDSGLDLAPLVPKSMATDYTACCGTYACAKCERARKQKKLLHFCLFLCVCGAYAPDLDPRRDQAGCDTGEESERACVHAVWSAPA